MAKFSITGTLDGVERKEAVARLVEAGHEFAGSVTFDTDYLVATRLDSTKARSAVEKGVRVLTQNEFEEMLDSGNVPERHHENAADFSDLTWTPIEEKVVRSIEYADADGVIRDLKFTPLATASRELQSGRHLNYLRVRDHEDDKIKTLREDRVLRDLP